MKKQFRLAIFASGAGSNAINIIQYFKNHPQIQVVCVCYNRKNAGVKSASEKYNTETLYISKDLFVNSNKWLEYLESKLVNGIILAGFLKLVPKIILDAYEGSILNIHPALLPKYGGRGMYGMHVHEAVVDNKELETGITIHQVNERYDEGKIIFQKSFIVTESDDAKSISEKIKKTEHKYFPQVIEKFLLNEPMKTL